MKNHLLHTVSEGLVHKVVKSTISLLINVCWLNGESLNGVGNYRLSSGEPTELLILWLYLNETPKISLEMMTNILMITKYIIAKCIRFK